MLPICAQNLPPHDLEARVDAYVNPYVHSNNFSGVILVAKGNDILLRKGYGMANIELGVKNTPKAVFHVASVSKSFTAAAIILLEQRGHLNTKDILSKYIPDYPNGDRITLHNLLVHTSGIPNVNSFPGYDEKSLSPHELDEIISWFKNKPLQFEPGARYRYSNSNYNLLAKIIEKVSGLSYGEFLKKNIFEPLKMENSGHAGDPFELIPFRASGYMPARGDDLENAPRLVWSIKTGNGSIYTTVDDLYKWDRALYTDKIISEASRKKVFTDHIDGVGYGWFIRKGKPRIVAINGRAPGFSANLDRLIDEDICIVLLSNLYSSITHAMAGDLVAIVRGEERKPPLPSKPITIDTAVLDSYVGRYKYGKDFVYNPNMVGPVKRIGDWLVKISGGRRSYLIPLSQNSFLDRIYGGIITFEKDASGKVTHLWWSFGDESFKAEKIIEE